MGPWEVQFSVYLQYAKVRWIVDVKCEKTSKWTNAAFGPLHCAESTSRSIRLTWTVQSQSVTIWEFYWQKNETKRCFGGFHKERRSPRLIPCNPKVRFSLTSSSCSFGLQARNVPHSQEAFKELYSVALVSCHSTKLKLLTCYFNSKRLQIVLVTTNSSCESYSRQNSSLWFALQIINSRSNASQDKGLCWLQYG